ncbi:RIP metalloprotease RseP [Tannerella sp. oral taxon 808]|nr:RIP metalloprotease RseP [Tannerella sp. oral taxon 808]
METFLIKALQLILSLSILVLVHECGHFFFARLFKVRVEKFYLFFDPWFALFRFKPKKSETEYGIGWLPLGGYCKIAGMIDESMDKEQMAQPPQPWEFRSKSAGQRLLIMVGGVLFNFLLAILIYSMVLFTWGDTYLPLRNVTAGMEFSQTFHEIGFRDGDILLRADEEPLERLDEHCLRQVVGARAVTVLRDGQEVAIPIPADAMQRLLRNRDGFANYRYPAVIDKIIAETARQAGLREGDRVTAVDSVSSPVFSDLREPLYADRGREATLRIVRADGSEAQLTVPIDSTGHIGVQMLSPLALYKTTTRTYNLFTALPAGVALGWNTLTGYVGDMKYVFTREGASSIGGFGTIGNIFPSVWDWRTFWMLTAFLSVILAFMNILPIPALDGGHIMFLLYEVVTRRKPADKFLEYAQIAGMVLLFALLIYANGNDVFRFFFRK